ncbi:Fe/S biogenesis protein NfuA [Ensifer sp. M14]|uniref:NifU family protein n=1 Tax=Sinorhizobium/Ensifer group TaxID=227292 RepID=UPI0009858159|nr:MULTISPECIES: NifU family protein [Sinorhizobium/Ensifer group]OOG63150.1 NifU family protein [Sinorhizobium sp. A49]RDL53093.1 Fe/S biogenesis protein NfuA [Ensifer sp. M14]
MTARVDISLDALEAAFARIRPLILGHGGDIEIADISPEGVVSVKLVGACKACPNIAMTYVGPIRTYLMEVDGVAEVRCEQVNASLKTLDRLARRLGSRPLIAG